MDVHQVTVALGAPNSINATTRESGTSEQWVYDSKNVYFNNGSVTAIQESR